MCTDQERIKEERRWRILDALNIKQACMPQTAGKE
jgi:hypothetical protein